MRTRCYSEGSAESPRTRIPTASRCQSCTESASCYIPSHTGQSHMDVFSCVCVHTCVSILFNITQNQNSDNRQFRLEKKKHPTRQLQLLAHPQDSHVSLKEPLIFHKPPFPHPCNVRKNSRAEGFRVSRLFQFWQDLTHGTGCSGKPQHSKQRIHTKEKVVQIL